MTHCRFCPPTTIYLTFVFVYSLTADPLNMMKIIHLSNVLVFSVPTSQPASLQASNMCFPELSIHQPISLQVVVLTYNTLYRCIQKIHLQTMELALAGVHMSLLLNFQCAALTGANSPLVLCWLMQASSLFGRSLIGVSGAVRGNTFHC